MNTQHLIYAIEVEKTGSITQAADNLYMAQPNLSRGIKELETSLGIRIFKRTSKGVSITKKRSRLLYYAKNILAQIENMEALRLPEDPGKQVFNVTYPHGGYISHAVSRFVSGLDGRRAMQLKIQETNSSRSISQVAEGQFNLGIVRYQPSYETYLLEFLTEKNLSSKLIWEFDSLVLMSRGHRLADADAISGEDLSDSIEIEHGDVIAPHFPDMESCAPRKDRSPVRKISLHERGNPFELLMRLPSAYMWAPPVPDDILSQYDLVQRQCGRPRRTYKDILIFRDGYAFSDLDKRFIDEVFSIKNQVDLKKYR
jgi:DNA-binding transcriptional LysR family regulator